MLDPSELLRRGIPDSTAFWNSSDAFIQSQANKSFTYQIGVEWHIFSKSELGGLAVTALAGLLSMVSIVALLIFITYQWFLKYRITQFSERRQLIKDRRLNASFLPFSPQSGTFDSSIESQVSRAPKNAFWQTQTSKLLLCLFLSDLIQSISGVIQLHWIANGRIDDNTACKVQGAFLHLGDVATAIWSAGIAFLTFTNIVLKANIRDWMVVAFIIFGWTTAVILNIVGPIAFTVSEEWFGIAGGWCFITSSFLLPRIFLHYVPMFLAAFIILVSYTLVALHLRGILTHDESGRFGWNWHRDHSSTHLTSSYAKSMSWKVMWYPLAYIVLIIPDASNRLAALMGRTSPDGLWYVGMAMLFSMGWVNVLIYCTTRNVLGIKRSKNSTSVMVSTGSSSKVTASTIFTPKFPTPTPLPPAFTPASPKAQSPILYQETFPPSTSSVQTPNTGTPMLNLPPFGTWDEFQGTPFQNPFTAPAVSPRAGIRSVTSMISPLTPLSQVGLAVTTPNGMIRNLPPATTSSSSLKAELLPKEPEPSLRPISIPESPSMYSCESAPHQQPPSAPSPTSPVENPFDPASETEEVAELPSIPSPSKEKKRARPSVPVSMHSFSESSSFSPTSPSSTNDAQHLGRKLSLYPTSVKSTDSDFEFGKTELDSYPFEGWIPIKM